MFIIISKLGFIGERVKHLFLPSRNGPSKGQHSSDGISFMDGGGVCVCACDQIRLLKVKGEPAVPLFP